MKMKRLVFVVTACLMGMSCFAQERLDTLVFVDGRKEAVNIKVNYREKIEYCFPGEDMLNVYDKSDLSKIIFKSGRVEVVSKVAVGDKPEVADETEKNM